MKMTNFPLSCWKFCYFRCAYTYKCKSAESFITIKQNLPAHFAIFRFTIFFLEWYMCDSSHISCAICVTRYAYREWYVWHVTHNHFCVYHFCNFLPSFTLTWMTLGFFMKITKFHLSINQFWPFSVSKCINSHPRPEGSQGWSENMVKNSVFARCKRHILRLAWGIPHAKRWMWHNLQFQCCNTCIFHFHWYMHCGKPYKNWPGNFFEGVHYCEKWRSNIPYGSMLRFTFPPFSL